MATWPLWKVRPLALAYILAVQAAALAVVGWVVATTPPPTSRQRMVFALLAVTAGTVIVTTSLSLHRRHGIRRNPWAIHIVYLAAGGLLLPPSMLVLLLLGPALHGVLDARCDLHRWLFDTSAMALAVFAARWMIGWHQPHWTAVTFVVGGVVLLSVRAALIACGLWLRNPAATRTGVWGDPIDLVLGIVAASLGGLLAMAADTAPVSALLAAPPMALLELAGQLPQWRRSAQQDAKTGLANATYWEQTARSELARAHARSQPVAVLLLDLDHFKRVNDEIGHLAGDAVLAAVAVALRGNVRRGDLVGRFGGEEFVVLLRRADIEVACTLANRLRLSTAALTVPTLDARGNYRELEGLTVSVGVAGSQRFGYELSDILSAADAALLAAKSAGRNAVTLA